MAKRTEILLVEDDEGHARLVRKAFRGLEDRFLVNVAGDLKTARSYLSENTPHVIVADLLLPDGRGLDLLQDKKKGEEFPFPLVVMTSHGDESVAVEAMKAGALDYVVKSGETLKAVPRVVQRALREWGHIVKQREAEKQLQKLNKKLTEANKKLEMLANLDPLTGIANRRNFMETFELEWKRAGRNKLPLSLIMIDVDFFKAYNDNYGHQAGDDCLIQIAFLLNGALARTGDMLARYGGEEFVVILPGTDARGTSAVAERLRKKIEAARRPHAVSTVSDYVTISLGSATTIPANRKPPESLIATADEALYKAKRNGRNRCEV
ncbi:MAG: diguanylate cyclase [bacterium]|nr:diguanylate cyclase [bacterium]